MNIITQYKILNTNKYYEYLKENSMFIKDLNRSSVNYKIFDDYIKNKYTLRISDRLNKILENVDNVSNLLNLLK